MARAHAHTYSQRTPEIKNMISKIQNSIKSLEDKVKNISQKSKKENKHKKQETVLKDSNIRRPVIDQFPTECKDAHLTTASSVANSGFRNHL